MMKIILIAMLITISGCKDKYEIALDDVKDTSISVTKCELKKLAHEKPKFPCEIIEHEIAIEKARTYAIKEGRIQAALNIGRLQALQESKNLILKGNYMKTATDYKSNAIGAGENSKVFERNLRLFESGFDISYEQLSDMKIYTPNVCSKVDFVSRGGWNFYKIKNINYNREECISTLKNEIRYNNSQEAIWSKKAGDWEIAAKKIKSEY